MKQRMTKGLKITNILLILFIIIGMTLMFYSAVEGDIYRLAQQKLKITVFFCMIVITTNISYGLLSKMKSSFKYGTVALISVFLMSVIFILNNVLHYIGFVSMFSESIETYFIQFCLDDLRYMNWLGLYRYAGILAGTMICFYIIDKKVYRLLINPFEKMTDLIMKLFVSAFNKLGLTEWLGLNVLEEDANDEYEE